MNVLVTGGAGFIGSAIARALLKRGDRVTVLDNLLTGREEDIPSDAEFIKADIRDLQAVETAFTDVEVVLHQAAFKSVPKSVDDPITAETCNGLGTLNVLLAAEKEGVQRVVYASSSSVYGEIEGTKKETMATNPISPYGVSKLAGEHYCQVWARIKGLSTVSLRYFNVYGPGQHLDSKYAAAFPAFISALNQDLPAQIHGDGDQTRDFTFIDDVVRVNLLAMEADSTVSGEVINISSGRARSVNDVYRTISKTMGNSRAPVHVDRRKGDVRHSHADISKARAILGWSPEADWDEAVRATVEWFVRKQAAANHRLAAHPERGLATPPR